MEALLHESRATAQALEERVQRLQAENETLQQNQQQTISLLVSEKASLASELERLEGVENCTRSLCLPQIVALTVCSGSDDGGFTRGRAPRG